MGAENLAQLDFDPRTVQPVARRYTDLHTEILYIISLIARDRVLESRIAKHKPLWIHNFLQPANTITVVSRFSSVL